MKSIIPYSRKLLNRRVLIYLAVGISAFVLDFVVFLVLSGLQIMPLYLANFAALVVGFLTSFFGNKLLTFRPNEAEPAHGSVVQFLLYTVLVLINSAITYFVILLFIEIGYGKDIGKIISMLLIILWNFFLYREIIFKRKV